MSRLRAFGLLGLRVLVFVLKGVVGGLGGQLIAAHKPPSDLAWPGKISSRTTPMSRRLPAACTAACAIKKLNGGDALVVGEGLYR